MDVTGEPKTEACPLKCNISDENGIEEVDENIEGEPEGEVPPVALNASDADIENAAAVVQAAQSF